MRGSIQWLAVALTLHNLHDKVFILDYAKKLNKKMNTDDFPERSLTPEQSAGGLIEDFDGRELDEDPTERKGFFIHSSADHGSYIKCFEGYRLHGDYPSEKETIEPDVLELAMLSVNTNDQGVGTRLMEGAMEEAKRRGFTLARATVENPRVVSILNKLQAQGVVAASKYVLHPTADGEIGAHSTRQIIDEEIPIIPEDVIDYLSALPHDEYSMVIGMQDNRVDVVLNLD